VLEEVEEDEGVVLVEVDVGVVEVEVGVVDVEVEVEVGTTLLEGMVDEDVVSTGSGTDEGEGDGAGVVGAGEDVGIAAAELAVDQYLVLRFFGSDP
jgi:hypothetical protein